MRHDEPDSAEIRGFFERIASRYDLANSLLSFRLDDHWRRSSARRLAFKEGERVVDLGTGTGKFLNCFASGSKAGAFVGIDFSETMLEKASKALPPYVKLLCSDFHRLSLASESFDLAISAFTLRSVREPEVFFREVSRILSPGGRAGFLCLTRPENKILSLIHQGYLNFYMPWMGRLLSGDPAAYQFLSGSIQSFPDPQETAERLKQCGFASCEIQRFSGGIATLLIAKK